MISSKNKKLERIVGYDALEKENRLRNTKFRTVVRRQNKEETNRELEGALRAVE
ncbi:MAG TPA: hypothetical protein VJB69_02920 [Candidatus Paceibacterota bacterium]